MTQKERLTVLLENCLDNIVFLAQQGFGFEEQLADYLINSGVVVLDPWICVKDQMPDDGENVLLTFVLFDGSTETEYGFWDGYSKWNISGYSVTFDKDRVTHWMPKPEPPEVTS